MSGREEKIQDVREEQPEIEEQDSNETEAIDETPQDTVRRLLEEAQEENEQEVQEEGQEVAEQPEQQPELEPLEAPQRFTAEERALFSKADRGLQEALVKMVKDHDATFHRKNHEYTVKQREAEKLIDTVNSYYLSQPDIMQAGYTKEGFLSALIGAHQELSDPNKAPAKIIAMGEHLGLDMSSAKNQHSQQQQPSDPRYDELRETIKPLQSFVEQANQAQKYQATQSLAQTISELQQTRDASGNFIYPGTHEEGFFKQAEPLIEALRKSTPGLSWKDAIIRAHSALRGVSAQPAQPQREVTQEQQPISLAANSKENLDKARRAMASVRGRSGPTATQQAQEIPAAWLNGSAKDTTAKVLEFLQKGGSPL